MVEVAIFIKCLRHIDGVEALELLESVVNKLNDRVGSEFKSVKAGLVTKKRSRRRSNNTK